MNTTSRTAQHSPSPSISFRTAASWHLRTGISYLSPLLGAGRRIVGTFFEPHFRALMFHSVLPSVEATFREFIEHCLKVYSFVSPGQAEAILHGCGEVVRTAGPPPCLVTFDDGLLSSYSVARSVLEPNGIKALFFVNPGLIDVFGRKSGGASSDAADPESIMSWREVEHLIEAGHVIGSHGLLHRQLAGLRPAELQEEVEGAQTLFETRLAFRPAWFAFPFGRLTSIDVAALERIRACHTFCCSGLRGLNGQSTHPLAIRRDAITLNAGPLRYQDYVIQGGLDLLYRRRAERLDAYVRAASITESDRVFAELSHNIKALSRRNSRT